MAITKVHFHSVHLVDIVSHTQPASSTAQFHGHMIVYTSMDMTFLTTNPMVNCTIGLGNCILKCVQYNASKRFACGYNLKLAWLYVMRYTRLTSREFKPSLLPLPTSLSSVTPDVSPSLSIQSAITELQTISFCIYATCVVRMLTSHYRAFYCVQLT